MAIIIIIIIIITIIIITNVFVLQLVNAYIIQSSSFCDMITIKSTDVDHQSNEYLSPVSGVIEFIINSFYTKGDTQNYLRNNNFRLMITTIMNRTTTKGDYYFTRYTDKLESVTLCSLKLTSFTIFVIIIIFLSVLVYLVKFDQLD